MCDGTDFWPLVAESFAEEQRLKLVCIDFCADREEIHNHRTLYYQTSTGRKQTVKSNSNVGNPMHHFLTFEMKMGIDYLSESTKLLMRMNTFKRTSKVHIYIYLHRGNMNMDCQAPKARNVELVQMV